MKYFRIDNKKVVHFEHTDELATKLNEVIASLRTATAKLDPELGKYVKDKTPGPRKVKLGVKMALKNNGFDLKKNEFSYQGRIGAITRGINGRLNSKIKAATPSGEALAEGAIAQYLKYKMSSHHVPDAIASKIAETMAHAVVTQQPPEVVVPTLDQMRELGQAAETAIQNTAASARSLDDVIEIDRDKNLIIFRNTEKIATAINTAIADVREVAAAIPEAGPQLSSEVKKKTPGPTKIRRAVGQVLEGNAFNYKTHEFESQSFALGTTQAANSIINKRIKKAESKYLNVTEMTVLVAEKLVAHECLSALPEEHQKAVAHRIVVRALEEAEKIRD